MDFKTTIMNKKCFFKLLFILTINLSFSQGNLQFNRVISEMVTSTIKPLNTAAEKFGTLMGNIVVPNNKVLKLESISFYINDNTGDLETLNVTHNQAAQYDSGVWIGNHLVWAPYVYTSVGSSNYDKFMQTANFPIWYGAGTYEIRSRTNAGYSSPPVFYVLTYSAIEFNIN